MAPFARSAAGRRIPCTEASDREVDGFAGSPHHEGLCVEARARPWTTAQELEELLLRSRGTAIALDRVRNPYNVGAVLRSAAFFGLDAALIGAPAPHSGLPPTAVRVAEGGAEQLRLVRTTDLAETLARLRSRGVHVYGADARAATSVFGFSFARPAVLVVGHEREGLADRVRSRCHTLLAIPARGHLESLNVGVAAGVLMGAMMNGPPPAAAGTK